MRAQFFRFHRWITLLFGLPLFAVLFTGLILSVEPYAIERAVAPGTIDAARLETLIANAVPGGRARAVALRAYDGTLSLGTASGNVVIDIATGERLDGVGGLAALFSTARRAHETLLFEATWLVVATTVAMVVLIALGLLMGWPRIANSVSGWHKAAGWGFAPLLLLSPVTGLLIWGGITFAAPPPPRAAGPLPALTEAVRVLGAAHDLSALVWLRPQGGRYLARIVEDGEFRVYAVEATGAVPMPRNWPRLWHEGNFAGPWSAAMNVVLSITMLGLLGTGTWLWGRRKWRRFRAAPRRPDRGLDPLNRAV